MSIHPCIECDDEVRPRQQALQCDVYGRSYGLSDHMIDFCIVKIFMYVFTNVQSKFSSLFVFSFHSFSTFLYENEAPGLEQAVVVTMATRVLQTLKAHFCASP